MSIIGKKLIKYIIFLIIIYICTIFVTKSKLDFYQNLAIGLCGTTTYAILDQYAPSYIIEERDSN